jgi:hypothetical protein
VTPWAALTAGVKVGDNRSSERLQTCSGVASSLTTWSGNAEDTQGELTALLKDLLSCSPAVLLRGVAGNSGDCRSGGAGGGNKDHQNPGQWLLLSLQPELP